jgi:hypothetical protein
MKYLALIYDDEKLGGTPEAQQAVFNEYMAYEEWLAKTHAGKKLGGEALQPTSTATTIRIRDGKRLMTDGPFAETREALGGYYLFEAKDLDEAIKLAEKIPSVKVGSIEVRPVMSFDMPSGE